MPRLLRHLIPSRRWIPGLWRTPDGLRRSALACLAGTLVLLTFPKWNLWPLGWIALVPLLAAIGAGQGGAVERALGKRQVFFLGWMTGFVVHAGGAYWLVHTMTVFGKMPWIAAAPVLALFAAYGGILWGLLALLWAWHWPRGRAMRLHELLVLAAFLPMLDWLLWKLFPWHIANGQHRFLPVLQIAEFTGPYGVSWVLALASVLIHALRLPMRPPLRAWAPALGLILLVLAYGHWRVDNVDAKMQAAAKVRVGLVQGNISLEDKWRGETREAQLEKYIQLSEQALEQATAESAPLDLLIWPESALPFMFGGSSESSTALTNMLRARVHRWGVPLLFGSLGMEMDEAGERSYRNRVYLMTPDGDASQHYDKIKLLAFGEYPPLIPAKWLRKYIKNVGNFTRGANLHPLETGGMRLSVLICYEVLFPDFAAALNGLGSNLLVTVTNDMWFGDTAGPWQHWALLQLRAVESRRSLVRSANTGVTGWMDPTGRVRGEGPLFAPHFMVAEVPLAEAPTFYTRYGNLFVALLSLGSGAALLIRWRSARRGSFAEKRP